MGWLCKVYGDNELPTKSTSIYLSHIETTHQAYEYQDGVKPRFTLNKKVNKF